MSDYDKFAKVYSDSMGEIGDEVHQTQIDPYVFKIVGDPKGKMICDLGCGNGYMARNFARKGGKVFASDISEKLINIAKQKSKGLNISYAVHSADKLNRYKDKFFDLVVMNMSIHYIKDIGILFKGVSRILKNNGVFVFSTNHFFRPNAYSKWEVDKINGEEKLFIKVTNYLGDKGVEVISGWDNKTKMMIYNHTLSNLVNGMSKFNLLTYKVYEPEPINSGQAFSKKLQKSHHIPTFIIFGSIKIL